MDYGHIKFTGDLILTVDKSSEKFYLIGEIEYMNQRKERVLLNGFIPTDNINITSCINYGGSMPQPYNTGIDHALIIYGKDRYIFDFNIPNFYSICDNWLQHNNGSATIWTQKCNVTNNYPNNIILVGELVFDVEFDSRFESQYPTRVRSRTISKESVLDLQLNIQSSNI